MRFLPYVEGGAGTVSAKRIKLIKFNNMFRINNLLFPRAQSIRFNLKYNPSRTISHNTASLSLI